MTELPPPEKVPETPPLRFMVEHTACLLDRFATVETKGVYEFNEPDELETWLATSSVLDDAEPKEVVEINPEVTPRPNPLDIILVNNQTGYVERIRITDRGPVIEVKFVTGLSDATPV